MGKFLKYEDSNFRTFVIDTTGGTIVRPKKHITKDDLLGAIFTLKGVGEAIVNGIAEADGVYTIYFGLALPGGRSFTYTIETDTFYIGEQALTNIMIDEFGRELVSLD